MKAKYPSGGSRGLTVPKMTVVSRKNCRSGNGGELNVDDTTVFPPLRVDHGTDPKITISQPIPVDRNGMDGQATCIREEVFIGEQKGSSEAAREVPKLIMSERSSFPADLKITDANYIMQKQSEVASGYSVESKSALAELIASDEPRSEHYALT